MLATIASAAPITAASWRTSRRARRRVPPAASIPATHGSRKSATQGSRCWRFKSRPSRWTMWGGPRSTPPRAGDARGAVAGPPSLGQPGAKRAENLRSPAVHAGHDARGRPRSRGGRSRTRFRSTASQGSRGGATTTDRQPNLGRCRTNPRRRKEPLAADGGK